LEREAVDVERHVAHRSPVSIQRIKHQAGLTGRPRADLDDVTVKKTPGKTGSNRLEERDLRPRRIVFRKLRDSLEEQGPGAIVKVFWRQGLGSSRQATADIVLEPGLLRTLVGVYVNSVAHDGRSPASGAPRVTPS